MDRGNGHDETIVDQFTRQAEAFAALAPHSDADAMRLCLSAAANEPGDRVLDVACGPGLVTCEAAKIAAHVDGLDITPAMIELAVRRQREEGLDNIDWHSGDVRALPWNDRTFDVALCRYAFHHFQDPAAVFAEMVRVAKPDGRVVVIDVAPPPGCRERYDTFERVRDPSHARALTPAEIAALGHGHALTGPRIAGYGLDVILDHQIAASHPIEGGADILRSMVHHDMETGNNSLGVSARTNGRGEAVLTIPVVVAVWRKL
jgi:SAM-dependent methyltransferase